MESDGPTTTSLTMPDEIVADRVMPTLRSMLAVDLADRGLTQSEIAAHLGVTQAAVSAYLADGVATEESIRSDRRTVETVVRLGEGIATDTLAPYDVLAELLDLIHQLEDRGPICAIHEDAMPALEGLGCDLCVRGADAEFSAERAVLNDVRRAARRLAGVPGLAAFIPSVGTNVGMALADATDIQGVAAIPGRIYTIKDRIEVPANPEFGASQHVATVILAAMGVDDTLRGAVNLANDDRLLAAARERGIDPLEFDPDYGDRRERLSTRFESRGDVPTVLYHRGAFGIEPVTYVLGPTAGGAVDLVRRLLTDG